MQNVYLFWTGRFSNWTKSQFTVDGITFNCGEQYMMYQKAMCFGDVDIAKRIMATADPRLQKELGRKVSNYDDTVWANTRFDVMVRGLYERFSQNSQLKQMLLDTGSDIIAEASPYDTIWGIGLGAGHPYAKNPNKWRGQNLLGKVLMVVRDKLHTNV